MADPTQPLRDSIAAGLKSIIPSNSPLAQSGASALTPEALAKMEEEKAALEAPVTRQPTSLPQVLPSQVVTRQAAPSAMAPQAPSTSVVDRDLALGMNLGPLPRTAIVAG